MTLFGRFRDYKKYEGEIYWMGSFYYINFIWLIIMWIYIIHIYYCKLTVVFIIIAKGLVQDEAFFHSLCIYF